MRPRAGHNLLEVVIAVTIFLTMVVMFVGIWSRYYQAQTLSRSRLAANSLGRSVLEQKLAAGFNNAVSDPTAHDVLLRSEIRGKPLELKLHYTFTVLPIVVPAIDPGQPSYKKLTVVVTWHDLVGEDKKLVYETHLYRTN